MSTHSRFKTELISFEVTSADLRSLLINHGIAKLENIGIVVDTTEFEPQVKTNNYGGYVVVLKEKER